MGRLWAWKERRDTVAVLTFLVPLSSPAELRDAMLGPLPQLKWDFLHTSFLVNEVFNSTYSVAKISIAYPCGLSVILIFLSIIQFSKALVNVGHAVVSGIYFNSCNTNRAWSQILPVVAFT